jgi:hypothetical protein
MRSSWSTFRHHRGAGCTSKFPLQRDDVAITSSTSLPSRPLRRGASTGSVGRSDACTTGSGNPACCCCGSSRAGKSGSTCAARDPVNILRARSLVQDELRMDDCGRGAPHLWCDMAGSSSSALRLAVALGLPFSAAAAIARLCVPSRLLLAADCERGACFTHKGLHTRD